MSDKDENLITMRILWTTTGMCQPFVSIAIKSEMIDDERCAILQHIADIITEGRKRQKDKVEVYTGCNCEDHVHVTVNAFHFSKTSKDGKTPAPAFVKWLCKRIEAEQVAPPGRLKISIVWLNPDTRTMHEQP